jgi:hypothetical protein
MMKTLTLRNAIMLSFVATTFFTACSKDKIDVTESQLVQEDSKATTTNEDNKTATANNQPVKIKRVTNAPTDGTDDLTYGSVIITITPADAVSQILIFNDDLSYETFTVTAPGEFQFDNIRTGNYTLVVVPNDDRYKKKEITDVRVAEGTTADLGSIMLEN